MPVSCARPSSNIPKHLALPSCHCSVVISSPEGDSQVTWFEGNYEAYEADRKRRLGSDADQPHRIKYRPLTR